MLIAARGSQDFACCARATASARFEIRLRFSLIWLSRLERDFAGGSANLASNHLSLVVSIAVVASRGHQKIRQNGSTGGCLIRAAERPHQGEPSRLQKRLEPHFDHTISASSARAFRTSLVVSPPSIAARIGSSSARGSLRAPASRHSRARSVAARSSSMRASCPWAISMALRKQRFGALSVGLWAPERDLTIDAAQIGEPRTVRLIAQRTRRRPGARLRRSAISPLINKASAR